MLTGTWHLIEAYIKIHDTVGRFVIKVDGITEVDFTGDTKPGADTAINNFYFVRKTSYFCVDSVAINDTTGAEDNSWIGNTVVIALRPNADSGSQQWIGQDGDSSNNYLHVDEGASDGDTTYVQTNTSGYKDLYDVSALSLPANCTIKRVYVQAIAVDKSASAAQIKLNLKPGSTDRTTTITLQGNYKTYVGTEYLSNPDDSTPWEATDFVDIKVGLEKV